MPRTRYLKPDFFKDEDIATLPHQVRLFFAGLWTQADKAGRLEDRPKRLKVELFPEQKADIEGMLELLAKPKQNTRRPFIVRYEIDGERYIQIMSWAKHQRPHHTEAESKIPPAPPLTENKDKGEGECHESMTELRNGERTVKNPLVDITKEFEKIWVKYPNRIGKKAAFKHFKASVKTKKNLTDIYKALENYKASKRVKKGYVQNGSTWFNNWQDWVNYREDLCDKCGGTGKVISITGFEGYCDCPAGVRKKTEKG